MALNSILNNQQDEDKENESNQSGVSQQAQQSAQTPITQVQPVTSANQQAKAPNIKQAGAQPQQPARPAPQPPQPRKVGTGYTNLNRILQANEGNKLGQTVAGGINQNIQNLQSGVQSAQDKFNTQSQANRLDSAENTALRQSVLGRFDESKYNVDENNFKLAQDLQDDYNKKNQDLQSKLAAAKQSGASSIADLENQIAKQQQLLSDYNSSGFYTSYSSPYRSALLNAGLTDGEINNMSDDELVKYIQDKNVYGRKTSYFNPTGSSISPQELIDSVRQSSPYRQGYLNFLKAKESGIYGHGQVSYGDTHEQALASLNNLLNTYKKSATDQETALSGQLTDLGKNFEDLTASEKAKWIQSEKDRMVAENLPNAEETEAFRKFITGAYTGPKELEDYQTLLGQSQQTEDLGKLARLQGGRQELLKQFVGGKDYTVGQRNMDEALLGQSPDASLLSRISKKALGSEDKVQQANKIAGAQAKDLTNRAKQFGLETGKAVQETRSPISNRIDQQVKALQAKETSRDSDFDKLQSILSGQDETTKNLDKNARLGLALQLAQDSGYLNQGQVSDLVSKGGLIDRANLLGLDSSKLILDRLSENNALGIDRRAAASTDQEKRVSALDRLLGKTGTDVEFGTGQENYKAGNIGLDTKNLLDYISKTEQERMQSNPAFSQTLTQKGLTPLQQILSGAAGQITGQLDANLQDFGNSVIDTNQGLLNLNKDAQVKALSELNKLFGGNSQMNQLIKGYDKLYGTTVGSIANEARNVLSAEDDLRSGKLDQVLSKVSGFDTAKNIVGNIGSSIGGVLSGSAWGAGKTGDWDAGQYQTVDYRTGAPVRIDSFANASSDDILNQMIKMQVNRVNITGNNQSGIQGSKELNQLLAYYNNALAQGR